MKAQDVQICHEAETIWDAVVKHVFMTFMLSRFVVL